MRRDEVIAILGTLKVAYPNFYKDMRKEELEHTVSLWAEMLKEDDARLVTAAVKSLITTLKFPPTIADIKETMFKLMDQSEDNMSLWNELDKAVRNCLYNTQEVFEGLSPLVKKFVGSPAQLRELALSDSDTFCTVTKGQFLKQVDILKQREKETILMLPETRQLVAELAGNFDAKRLLE